MPNSSEIAALNDEIRKLFPLQPHPGPEGIYDHDDVNEHGWDADHDAWMKWCGQHDYEEFLSAVHQGGFDPFEFGSLSPGAYLYFTPAVLLYCLSTLVNPLHHDPLEWIEALIPLPESEARFRAHYLALFTAEQRAMVARVLHFHAEAHMLREGAANDSVNWAIKIWGSAA